MGIFPMCDATPRVIFVAFARLLHEPVWMAEEGHSGCEYRHQDSKPADDPLEVTCYYGSGQCGCTAAD